MHTTPTPARPANAALNTGLPQRPWRLHRRLHQGLHGALVSAGLLLSLQLAGPMAMASDATPPAAAAKAQTNTVTATAPGASPALATPSNAAGALPAGLQAEYLAAMRVFDRATQGDNTAVDQAASLWTTLLQAHPQQPVLRAYAGASTAMRANTTLLPWKKMGHAEDGLALIDKALAQLTAAHDAPAFRGVAASLETRFTAASTFLALPDMFNRQERGQRLLREVLASPLLNSSPLPFKASVWLAAAEQAQKNQRSDEARRLLQQVADSGAPQAAAARSRLATL